jgi:hypothetical protein
VAGSFALPPQRDPPPACKTSPVAIDWAKIQTNFIGPIPAAAAGCCVDPACPNQFFEPVPDPHPADLHRAQFEFRTHGSSVR